MPFSPRRSSLALRGATGPGIPRVVDALPVGAQPAVKLCPKDHGCDVLQGGGMVPKVETCKEIRFDTMSLHLKVSCLEISHPWTVLTVSFVGYGETRRLRERR